VIGAKTGDRFHDERRQESERSGREEEQAEEKLGKRARPKGQQQEAYTEDGQATNDGERQPSKRFGHGELPS
jgi:hypothetical protein